MPQKKKNLHKTCQVRHNLPTGQKCSHFEQNNTDGEENELSQDAAGRGGGAVPSKSKDDRQRMQ